MLRSLPGNRKNRGIDIMSHSFIAIHPYVAAIALANDSEDSR
jgi:hypothetical protein